MPLDDTDFRSRLRDVLARSGRSMRALSAALGRDPGYVAALLDPDRPSRARPTPADLVRASDATGIPFVELLERLWAIPAARLADELGRLGVGGPLGRSACLPDPGRTAERGRVRRLPRGAPRAGAGWQRPLIGAADGWALLLTDER